MTLSNSKVPKNTHLFVWSVRVGPPRSDQEPVSVRSSLCLPAGSNACRVNNGGCSSLCLATPGGRQCGCADDQILDPANNSSCKGVCSQLSALWAGGTRKAVIFSVPER